MLYFYTFKKIVLSPRLTFFSHLSILYEYGSANTCSEVRLRHMATMCRLCSPEERLGAAEPCSFRRFYGELCISLGVSVSVAWHVAFGSPVNAEHSTGDRRSSTAMAPRSRSRRRCRCRRSRSCRRTTRSP